MLYRLLIDQAYEEDLDNALQLLHVDYLLYPVSAVIRSVPTELLACEFVDEDDSFAQTLVRTLPRSAVVRALVTDYATL